MPPRLKKGAVGATSGSPSKAQAGSSSDSKPNPAKGTVTAALYDGPCMRGVLDDEARQVVIDAGYDEDTKISNTRIALGSAAVACALYAQFGSGKFPASWWTLLYCVAAYVLFSTLSSLHAMYIEDGALLICKPMRGSSSQGLRLRSSMERFCDQYTLYIYQGHEGKPGYREVSFTASLTSFFREDGLYWEPAFVPQVEQLLAKFEAKKDS